MRRLETSPLQFAVFRIALGAFLAHHFLALVPYAGEIYGPAGMFPLEFQTSFPNLLSRLNSPVAVRGFFVAHGILAILFASGMLRRGTAVLLWYGWACLTNRVPFLFIPSEGLVGWLLLLSAAVPSGEPLSVYPRSSKSWTFPPTLIASLWLVVAVGYLASGVDKLTSPSWRLGTALRSVLTSPIARWDFFGALAATAPDRLIHCVSWGIVAIEVGFIGMIWHPATRALAWATMTITHLLIRVLLDLHTISDAFLVSQILMYDVQWTGKFRAMVRSTAPKR